MLACALVFFPAFLVYVPLQRPSLQHSMIYLVVPQNLELPTVDSGGKEARGGMKADEDVHSVVVFVLVAVGDKRQNVLLEVG